MDRLLKTNLSTCRVGLISPCLGNLGNAAILSSMIDNVRKRIPGAEIVGITLSLEDTRRRHGIDAFPLCGVRRKNYAMPYPKNSKTHNQPPNELWQWVKGELKRIPLLRPLVVKIRVCSQELAYIVSAARLVRKLDCVIVTGGGALDDFWSGPWGHPWTLFKFAALSQIYRVPFFFVSVGKCALEHPFSRFFASNALRMAKYRSYRDHDSRNAVQALIHSFDERVSPDLAYGYSSSHLPAKHGNDIENKGLVVGVSPIAYCDPRVWPIADKQRYERYIHELAQMVKWLVAEKHRVVLFATDNPDPENIRDLQSLISDGSVDVSSVQVLPGPPEQTTEGLLERICQVDLVIASRLHGIILSHLLAIPVLAISYDRKVEVHMNEIGQGNFCLDIDRINREMLIERFNALRVTRKQESAHLEHAVRLYREQVDAQYDRLFGTARASGLAQEDRGRLASAVSSG